MSQNYTLLYRNVLKALNTLPGDMRAIGWEHVRQEFRLHRSITDEKVTSAFINEWRQFIQAIDHKGQYRHDDGYFSDDQAKRLDLLRKELSPDEKDQHNTEK